MKKHKFYITTTVPRSLKFFSGQCKALKDTYEVCAISSPDQELKPFAEQEGIGYKALKMERDISLFSDICSLVKWICLLLAERPYVVHANTPKASLLAMIAAWLTFRPVRIYMCHGLRYQGCTGKKRKLLMMMERISCFCANRVICVSNGVREQFAMDGICALDKSEVIMYGSANGVDTEWFNPLKVDDTDVKAQNGITNDDWVLLFVGRIVRDKGIEELVDAVVRLHKEESTVKLLMVGAREESLDALSERTERLIKNSDFILECGRQSDVRPFIKASKLLVLPSYREGFGQVLIEANAMGVPVIASDIIGCNNVVDEGINGLLCQPKDKISLYNCIAKMLNDEHFYLSMRNQCRQYTVTYFDRKKVSKAYVKYYEAQMKS